MRVGDIDLGSIIDSVVGSAADGMKPEAEPEVCEIICLDDSKEEIPEKCDTQILDKGFFFFFY